VNLGGFFHITQCALRQMVDQGSGHIVNITTSIVDRPSSERPSALVSCLVDSLAVSADGVEDLFCGLDPHVGAGVLVPGVDPPADVGVERADRAVSAAPQLPAADAVRVAS